MIIVRKRMSRIIFPVNVTVDTTSHNIDDIRDIIHASPAEWFIIEAMIQGSSKTYTCHAHPTMNKPWGVFVEDEYGNTKQLNEITKVTRIGIL